VSIFDFDIIKEGERDTIVEPIQNYALVSIEDGSYQKATKLGAMHVQSNGKEIYEVDVQSKTSSPKKICCGGEGNCKENKSQEKIILNGLVEKILEFQYHLQSNRSNKSIMGVSISSPI
jgi:hypothetical protein